MADIKPGSYRTPKEKQAAAEAALMAEFQAKNPMQGFAPPSLPQSVMPQAQVPVPVSESPPVRTNPFPVRTNPFGAKPQKSNLDQLKDLFAARDEDLAGEEEMLQKLKGDIDRFQKADSQIDFTPLAAFADTFTGSNIASKVVKPLSKEEREVTAMKLNSELLERIQKVRAEKERRMDEIKLKLLGMDNQKDMTFAKLEENSLLKEAINAAKQDVINDKNEKKLAELEVPGIGHASSKQEAEKLKEAHKLFLDITNNLKEMEELRGDGGGEIIDQDKVARGKLLASDSLVALNKIAGLGALAKDDLKLLTDVVPRDPLAFDAGSFSFGVLGDPTKTKLTTAKTTLTKKFHNYLKVQGVGDEMSRYRVTGLTDNLMTPEEEKQKLLKEKK